MEKQKKKKNEREILSNVHKTGYEDRNEFSLGTCDKNYVYIIWCYIMGRY